MVGLKKSNQKQKENTMVKRKRTNRKTLHRKPKIEQHEKNRG
jgi:hypothetical protein